MNEQIEKYLLNALEGIGQGVSTGIDFLAGEIPLYIQELLIWYAVKSGLFTLIGLVLIIGTVYIFIKYGGAKKDGDGNYKVTLTHNDNGDFDAHVIGTGFTGFFLIVLGGHLMSLDWLQIIIAPRVWLLEYAATLVK